jgi:hypothetical protein
MHRRNRPGSNVWAANSGMSPKRRSPKNRPTDLDMGRRVGLPAIYGVAAPVRAPRMEAKCKVTDRSANDIGAPQISPGAP